MLSAHGEALGSKRVATAAVVVSGLAALCVYQATSLFLGPGPDRRIAVSLSMPVASDDGQPAWAPVDGALQVGQAVIAGLQQQLASRPVPAAASHPLRVASGQLPASGLPVPSGSVTPAPGLPLPPPPAVTLPGTTPPAPVTAPSTTPQAPGLIRQPPLIDGEHPGSSKSHHAPEEDKKEKP